MALVKMVMPKMGESIMEGTIINWLKKEGDRIEQDEYILEVATDKVDTEVPATHSGILKQILAKEGEVVPVGQPIAIIETEGEGDETTDGGAGEAQALNGSAKQAEEAAPQEVAVLEAQMTETIQLLDKPQDGRFYSPLVMSIAKTEGIGMDELARIPGTGKDGRVTKADILAYVEQKKKGAVQQPAQTTAPAAEKSTPAAQPVQLAEGITADFFAKVRPSQPIPVYEGDEIIEMDRMRKIIAQRMVESKHISPHVTSFVEADVTNLVYWRRKIKAEFQQKENDTITYMPMIVEAVVKALKDYPMMNVSVDGDKIIKHKDINIGIAVALPNGNLIVPVLKNADRYNIVGLAKAINDLARRARENKLKPDELTGGTYTISNVGSFGNVMGTPIIMQPQVGILAIGAIRKKPAVIETPTGDMIGIRHMVFLSHSYDHRVVDGALGGMFVRRVADYLENFNLERKLY
ncbi:dihydrolipoamide acetyltransferase family protein [Thermonema rossianum]|jgi:2-oxoglutarate dehydrogenase E2 component (dihydrolipoamide succinyltransferase)|uniref:dihydrolipoamide acetyltransferase family protein n=1 Tax=Thermonema rossianum TaxID=55505 RepID=UPI000570816C|nr:dihydrolipoamide acetyltransferase family protein [Thermonema rossianum]